MRKITFILMIAIVASSCGGQQQNNDNAYTVKMKVTFISGRVDTLTISGNGRRPYIDTYQRTPMLMYYTNDHFTPQIAAANVETAEEIK